MYNPPKSQFQEIYNIFGKSPPQFEHNDTVYVLYVGEVVLPKELTIGPQRYIIQIKNVEEFQSLRKMYIGY